MTARTTRQAETPARGEASETAFQTSLEQQHLVPDNWGASQAALCFNPTGTTEALCGSAQARMQALHDCIDAWMLAGDTDDVPLQSVLRPLDHLAQEVVMLLDELYRRIRELRP